MMRYKIKYMIGFFLIASAGMIHAGRYVVIDIQDDKQSIAKTDMHNNDTHHMVNQRQQHWSDMVRLAAAISAVAGFGLLHGVSNSTVVSTSINTIVSLAVLYIGLKK